MAFEDLLRMAEAGDPYAMRDVGICYMDGNGVERNNSKAMAWFRKAAGLGEPEAIHRLGVLYEKEKDYDEAMKLYLKATILGNTRAMTNLGYLYINGYGMEKDPVEAMRWYRRAADLGDPLAMRNLGISYYCVEQNREEATYWLLKARDLFDPVAIQIISNLSSLNSWAQGDVHPPLLVQ